MDDYAHERRGGRQWITDQVANMLGLTPDMLDWEQHSYGALLRVPVADDAQHHIAFDHQQINDASDDEQWRNHMRDWIVAHLKEAQRSPSSRENPHRCTLKPIEKT
ncbi:MAG: hypothetical protein ACRD3W_10015 [Terriglobales bacterium]